MVPFCVRLLSNARLLFIVYQAFLFFGNGGVDDGGFLLEGDFFFFHVPEFCVHG